MRAVTLLPAALSILLGCQLVIGLEERVPGAGGAGGADTGAGGSAGGAGTCVDPAKDCAKPAECNVAECDAKKSCITKPSPDGLPAMDTTPGDCHKRQCDGAGAAKVVVDDGDKPAGKDDCHIGVCSQGVPAQTAAPVNTPCGAGKTLHCDSGGVCVGCMMDSECPAGNDCETPSCNIANEQCGFLYAPPNTPLPAAKQMAGNCHVLVCDGVGGVTDKVDDSDVPAKPCFKCMNGAVTVTYDAQCSLGMNVGYCSVAGICVECNVPSECPQPMDPLCATASCSVQKTCGTSFVANGTDLPPANQTIGDCTVLQCDGSGNEVGVAQISDVKDDGNVCTIDSCNGTTPVNTPAQAGPPPQGNCPAATPLCDGAGQCVECNVNADCGAKVCYQHGCCTKTTCAAQNKTCAMISDNCGGMLNCGGAKDGTETDLDCGGNVSQCATRCMQGRHCSVSGDCANNNCADTFCCDVSCSGCNACSAALKSGGFDGVCGPAANGTDPHAVCGNYYCKGTGTCGTTCTVDSECKPGKICDTTVNPNHTCVAPKAVGQSCNRSQECNSNMCVSNICQ